MSEYGYTYLLASKGRRLYIGVTTRLEERMRQHKDKTDPNCSTARPNIDQLVSFERHPLITAAIARGKELKGWVAGAQDCSYCGERSHMERLERRLGKPVEISESSVREGIRALGRLQKSCCAQDDDGVGVG